MGRVWTILLFACVLLLPACTVFDPSRSKKESSPDSTTTLPSEEELYRRFGARSGKEKTIVNTGVGHCMSYVGVSISAENPQEATRLIARAKRVRERGARTFASSDLSSLERGVPSPSEMTERDRRLAREACSYGISLAIAANEERMETNQTTKSK